ncbi:Component of oligomeric golgi complex 6 [Fasciola gigantica]|uniref:Conserved oligomeric Golgi complex subunit 6 n=1 Tax=Fasciola gigantica TaxID=46835 RepID=A0A504Y8R5_FASGI|nr:Component of oligomeric golgi complex 6 [Fasciola gigantica]
MANGAQLEKNPLLSKIHKIINTEIERDTDLLDGLLAVSDILPVNNIRTRRNLRVDLEKQQLALYEDFLKEFTLVRERVEELDSNIKLMLTTCQDVNQQLMCVKSRTDDLINEAADLQAQSLKGELRLSVLQCVHDTFQISSEDIDMLCSSNSPIDANFFQSLERAHQIEKNCKDVIRSGEQNLGFSMLDSSRSTLESAYQRLYRWSQNECRIRTQDIPEIGATLRKAFFELQNRPVLFKYALDEYAGARRVTTVKSFIDALTLGSESSSLNPSGGHSKPIELHSHDPLRYTSDMLAWIHQLTASEKEYLGLLTRECHDTALTEIISACLDAITEGLCSPFKMRMEQLMSAQQDAVLLYRINNVLRFYQHTVCTILGSSTCLSNAIIEIQELSWRLLFNNLNQYIRNAMEQTEFPASDLSPNDVVRDTLQLLMEILRAHDISLLPADVRKSCFSQIITTLIGPLVTYCQNSADRIVQAALSESELLADSGTTISSVSAQSPYRVRSATYVINCLYLIETTLARLEYANDHVEQISVLLNQNIDTLVHAQVSAVLESTRLIFLLRVLLQGHDPARDGPLVSFPDRSDKNTERLSEQEVRNALVHFDIYLSNPDRYSLPELRHLTAQRLRKMIRRRAADAIHSQYQIIYDALVNPANGYCSFNSTNPADGSPAHPKLRSPQQVAELILNF